MHYRETLPDRMQAIGLPYEITNAETPEFMLTGGKSVIALFKDPEDDSTRAFVGFGHADPAGVARSALKMKSVYSAYVVNAVEKSER